MQDNKKKNKIIGDYKIKFHKFNGYYYSDVFFVSGGYCIIQHKDKDEKVSEDKAVSWIEKQK